MSTTVGNVIPVPSAGILLGARLSASRYVVDERVQGSHLCCNWAEQAGDFAFPETSAQGSRQTQRRL